MNCEGYQYDLFISFTGVITSCEKWVINDFFPTLRESFRELTSPVPRIYIYSENRKGSIWPQELEEAIATSAYLLPILTPPYFYDSHWCFAEWDAMHQRQQLLHTYGWDKSKSVILPVVYSDGDCFPEYAGKIRHVSHMFKFAYEGISTQDTPLRHGFLAEMRKVAKDILEAMPGYPPFDPSWPKMNPKVPLPNAHVSHGVPRLEPKDTA